MIRRHPIKLLVLALVALVAGLVLAYIARPTFAVAPTADPRPGESLVVVGVGGLSWHDVSAADTPALWGLLRYGSVATVSVKAMRLTTCPIDGWATLGAGEAAGPATADDRPGCTAAAVRRRAISSAAIASSVSTRLAHGVDARGVPRPGSACSATASPLERRASKPSAPVPPSRPRPRTAASRTTRRSASRPCLGDLAQCPVSIVDIGRLDVDRGRPDATRSSGSTARAAARPIVVDATPTGADLVVVGLADRGQQERPADPRRERAALRPGHARLGLDADGRGRPALRRHGHDPRSAGAWSRAEGIGGRALSVVPLGEQQRVDGRKTS